MKKLFFSIMVLAVVMSGCRGWTSKEPPVHLNPNMDTQNKYKPQRKSSFFTDKRDMRPKISGTIARGDLKSDEGFHHGTNNGEFLTSFPKNIQINKTFMNKGRMKFDIYCAVCHSTTGDGDGIVGRRMMIRPTSMHLEYLYQKPVGQIFDVISNGVRTMPGYKDRMSAEDRWATIAYIKALQLSQNSDEIDKVLGPLAK